MANVPAILDSCLRGSESDELTGGDILPDFKLTLDQLFSELDRRD